MKITEIFYIKKTVAPIQEFILARPMVRKPVAR